MIKRYGNAEYFAQNAKSWSDSLLKNQLEIYEQIVGPNTDEKTKTRLEILRAEAENRWGKGWKNDSESR